MRSCLAGSRRRRQPISSGTRRPRQRLCCRRSPTRSSHQRHALRTTRPTATRPTRHGTSRRGAGSTPCCSACSRNSASWRPTTMRRSRTTRRALTRCTTWARATCMMGCAGARSCSTTTSTRSTSRSSRCRSLRSSCCWCASCRTCSLCFGRTCGCTWRRSSALRGCCRTRRQRWTCMATPSASSAASKRRRSAQSAAQSAPQTCLPPAAAVARRPGLRRC
mmetsp:Transcript_5629/g.17097  ORF Transcript_5629/g.17097 Transcript_5629/m.17097 type:complete len:221 (-) Transcript_5629:152-814(-)